MKPIKLWATLTDGGDYRWASSGYLPLNRTAADASCGWNTGFSRPKVIEVELRPVRSRKGKKRGGKKGY